MSALAKRQIELTRPKGLRVFADAQPTTAEIAKQIADITSLFAAFKAENDKRLKELAAGKDDVITRDHVDKINAALTTQTKQLEDMQAKLAANAVMGGDNKPKSAAALAHKTGFSNMMRTGRDDGLRQLEIQAALTSDSDPDGGYLVPEETDALITRGLETVSAMRRLASVQTIGGSIFKTLHNNGGATAGWVSEQQSRPQTNTPTLTELSITTGELYAMPAATKTILEDGRIDMEAWLADEVRIVFAEQEGAAFVSGNGINKPRGFLDYSTVANASWSFGKLGFVVSGASGAFVTPSATVNPYDKLVDLYHALKPGYRGSAAWLMNDATLAEIRKIKDADGNYVYMPPTATEPGSILGKVVETDDNMPAIAANSFSIAFGDFKRGYLIVDRAGVQVLRDPFSSKPYVLFYTTKRVGGAVRDYATIKLMKFST